MTASGEICRPSAGKSKWPLTVAAAAVEPDDGSELGETWDQWYDRTKHARGADLDQSVAAIREKISRLGPELDQADPHAAEKRLALIFRAAVPEYGSDALAVVLADYVMRDRRR